MDNTKSVKLSVVQKLTLATVCQLQVDREPVTLTSVKSIAETPKPELPSLSVLG